MSDAKLYDSDIARWADEQADALRRHAHNEIDWENVAEEIGGLSRSDRQEIRSRLEVICAHLLKWQFQSSLRSGSWRSSIDHGRDRIADLIEESPSLAGYPATQLARAYPRARRDAANETGIADLPEPCPWTIEQVLDPDFWPEG